MWEGAGPEGMALVEKGRGLVQVGGGAYGHGRGRGLAEGAEPTWWGVYVMGRGLPLLLKGGDWSGRGLVGCERAGLKVGGVAYGGSVGRVCWTVGGAVGKWAWLLCGGRGLREGDV